MNDIFEIKFPIEIEIKEKVILKFSNKQGGAYNIFSYYWQCFVWAATIGFLRDARRPLAPGIDRIFTLNTMRGNGGEKAAQALICMCIARYGSVDIMKNPSDAIQMISEYANGGFYHIMSLMQNGENTFNDFEKVKQEIFGRNYWDEDSNMENLRTSPRSSLFSNAAEPLMEREEDDMVLQEDESSISIKEIPFEPQKTRQRWTISESKDLKNCYEQGMSIEQLAGFFSRSEENVSAQLEKLGLI